MGRTLLTLQADDTAVSIVEQWAARNGFNCEAAGLGNLHCRRSVFPHGASYIHVRAELTSLDLSLSAWIVYYWVETPVDGGLWAALAGGSECQRLLNGLLSELVASGAALPPTELPDWVQADWAYPALAPKVVVSGDRKVKCPNCGGFVTRPAGIGIRDFAFPGVLEKFLRGELDGVCYNEACRVTFNAYGVKGVVQAPPPSALPPRPAPSRSAKDRLLEIDSLYQQGLITDVERQRKRQEIIDSM